MFRTSALFHHQTHLSQFKMCKLPVVNNPAVPGAFRRFCSVFTLSFETGRMLLFLPVPGRLRCTPPGPPPRPAMTDTRSAEPASHLTTLLLLYDFPNRTGKRQGAHFSASPRDSASRSAESTSLGFPSGFQKLIPLIKIKEIKKSIRLLHDLPLPSRPTPPAATVSPPLN